MTLARANSTNAAKLRWLERMRDPDYVPPVYKDMPKEVGSKKLVHGEWITVKAGDEDAIAC